MTTTQKLSEAIQDENKPETQLTKVPTSYVLWLTFRSQFVDEMAKTDPTILERWKEYENNKLEELELWQSDQEQQP